jgi:exo-beta-1,3-glucanase (GH17 family)
MTESIDRIIGRGPRNDEGTTIMWVSTKSSSICLKFSVGLILASVSLSRAPADVLQNLTTQRHWIGYAPRNFNPNIGLEPSQAQIRADLEQLYAEGWRSVYTYSLDGVQRHVPRIAKEVGFNYTLAGVFYFDEAQLAREKEAAQVELAHIDGFIVGNEGLLFGRYTPERLVEEVFFFQSLGKPVIFAWGEAYDQPWKSEQSPFGVLGPAWGLHTQTGDRKQIISELQDIYTGPVPSVVPEPHAALLGSLAFLGLLTTGRFARKR